MAYDNTTQVTDDLDDNLAVYHNELKTAVDHAMSASAYAAYTRTQSMTGNVTLTDSDYPIQSFSPTAARDLTLPAVASTNHAFFIVNRSGTYEITVKNASAVVVAIVVQNSSLMFLSDGANGWYVPGDNRTIWDEVASAPTTPPSGKWRVYFKSGGLYIIDDAGTETGPVGAGGGSSGMPAGYLFGMGLSNNSTDATNDIDIATGKCRDITDAADITLASALTKRLDAAWAVGTNQGGLDTGNLTTWTSTVTISNASPGVVTWTAHPLVAGDKITFTTTGALPTGLTVGTVYYVLSTSLGANSFRVSLQYEGTAINTSSAGSGTHTIHTQKTYHVFAIKRSDTGVVDVLFSLSASAPTMPTNYDYKRRIFSIVRAGSAIKGFIQDGDTGTWKTPVRDTAVSNPGTSAVTRSLTVPNGIRVNAKVSALGQSNSGAADNPEAVYISDLSVDDVVANNSAFNLFVYLSAAAVSLLGAPLEVFTNTSGRVRTRIAVSTANTYLYLTTTGWIDTRDRV